MKKVLIVDDQPAFSKVLGVELANRGYVVVETANGKIGLKKAIKEEPDLILLDIRMPVMDGMTMLELLRKEKIGKKMKVIILTNLELDNEMVGKVISDRPLYYFVKCDTELSYLFKKIKKLLGE